MKTIPWRSIGLGAAVLALAGVVLYHAVLRPALASPAAPAAHAAPPRAAVPMLPQLPDADTIKDEPDVAPDPKQSADHNVSLPTDI